MRLAHFPGGLRENRSRPSAALPEQGFEMDRRITLLPNGFVYRPDFLSIEEETELLSQFEQLDFRAFDFHGYIAKRRVIEYGFEYDFGARRASAAQAVPLFLGPYKERVAAWAGVGAEELVEAIITEYPEGAPIGWHRDVFKFEIVIGISVGSACRLRFKPYKAKGNIVSLTLEPRSSYVIAGSARWSYQHSIPAVKARRYSITFRTLRTTPKPVTV
jgi:alkylated DNA repair dioxygenase AlkB